MFLKGTLFQNPATQKTACLFYNICGIKKRYLFKINLIHTNGFNTTHHNTNNTNLICRLSGNPPFYDETEEENTDMHNRIIFCRIVAGEFEFDSPYWDEISPAGTDIRIWYKFMIWSKLFKAFDVLNLILPLFNAMQRKSWSADLWILTRCWELLHKMQFRMNGKTIYKHTNANTQSLFSETLKERESKVICPQMAYVFFFVFCQDRWKWSFGKESEGRSLCSIWEKLC